MAMIQWGHGLEGCGERERNSRQFTLCTGILVAGGVMLATFDDVVCEQCGDTPGDSYNVTFPLYLYFNMNTVKGNEAAIYKVLGEDILDRVRLPE